MIYKHIITQQQLFLNRIKTNIINFKIQKNNKLFCK